MAAFRNYTTTPRRSDEVHYNPSYAWLGGDYNIGEWHLHADVDREIITLSHPAFHTVRMAGDKAREIFEELDDLYAADDLPAGDVWERYLSQYIRFTSDSKGVQARGMASRYESRSKRAQVADSDAGSDKLYTMSFKEMDEAFSTGLPDGYKFIGTGVAFMTNTRKRAHTVDFRNTNLDEDAEGATIEVPYDANTGTVAKVKEDLAAMVAGKSGKVSDAGHGKDTKYQPRRVSDAEDVGVKVRELYNALKKYKMTEHQGGGLPEGAVLQMTRSLGKGFYLSASVHAESMLSVVTTVDYVMIFENDYMSDILCSVAMSPIVSTDDVTFFISSVLKETKVPAVAYRFMEQAHRFRCKVTKPLDYLPALSRWDVELGSTYYVSGRDGMLPVRVLRRLEDEMVEVNIPAEKLAWEMYEDTGAKGDTSNGVVSIHELFVKVAQ